MTKLKIFFSRIKVQMTSYYLLVSLLMILIMSGVYYYSTSTIILQDTLDQTIYAVEQSSTDLQTYLSKMKATASYLATNDDVIRYLKKENTPAGKVIEQALLTDSSIASIVIVSKDGQVLSNEASLNMTVSDDMMKESWYENAVKNPGMPALTSARLQEFTMDKDTWVIALSQEIIDESGANLGVVLLDLKYEVIEGYLDHLPLGDNGFAFIMDDMAHVVYHPDPSYFTSNEKKANLIEMVVGKEGYDESEKLLTHHVDIPDTHWTLVGVSSLDRLDVVKRQLFEVLIVVGLIVLAVIFIGSYLIAQKITKPIRQLENAMMSMEKVKIHSGSFEVKQLSDQYHEMLAEIDRLLSEIRDNEQYLRQYELSALYSQINPHFLYNTLDTIVWMAEFNDSQKVIEVTKSLAQFFRISLSKGQEMISLENEIDHIRQYLFIQKQRYDDQLTYDIELDDSLKDIKVPKIILQPIVENAIYHGIKEKTGPGHISVSAKMTDKLILTVTDDGVGFEMTSKKMKLGGVGIENVRKRLKLVFGDQSDLLIHSAINEGTRVALILPIDV